MSASCFANYVHWSAFATCNLRKQVNIFLFHHQSHTFLRLVTHDFLSRKGRVADRQFIYMYGSTCFFNQFRKTVQVTASSVVVDGNNWIYIHFAQSTDSIVGTFLHFWVASLNGVQLNCVVVFACGNRRNCATAHTDAVVVTTKQHNLVANFWRVFQTVVLLCVANTASHHYYFVEAVFLIVFKMFERQDATADERLTEFVTEITCSVRCLDKNVFWRLVKPWTWFCGIFPNAFRVVQTGI